MQRKYWMVHTIGATVETIYWDYDEAYSMACKYAEANPTLMFCVLEVVQAVKSNKNLAKQQEIKQ